MVMIIIIGLLVLGLVWWVNSLQSKIDILEVHIKSIEKRLQIDGNDIKICLDYLTELQNKITELRSEIYEKHGK